MTLVKQRKPKPAPAPPPAPAPQSSAKPKAAQRWRIVVGCAFLLLATLVVYIPALRAGFIWDDPDYVLHNRTLRSLEGLQRIWLVPLSIPQWYPLVHTTFWIEYHLVGTHPTLYHVDNVLLHAISCMLLWRLLAKLDVPGAFIAACLLAVHPVMVESVAWITERKNVLSLLFYLLAMRVWLLRFDPTTRGEGKPNWRAYALALVFFLCALFSKTVTASLPAAVLLILWWKRGRLRFRDFTALIPFIVLGAALGAYTGYIEAHYVNGTKQLEVEMAFSFAQRCLIAGRAILFYFSKLFYPHPLMFIYPRWDEIAHPTLGQWIYPAAVVLIAVMLFLARKRIGRGPIVLWLLFCGTLFPALGFVNVYPMRYSFVADHFQYHAAIAIFVLVGAIIARIPIRVRVATCAVMVCVLGTLTFQQARHYKDAWTLWNDTLKKNPGSWMVWTNVANLLSTDQKFDAALPYYEKAYELAPDIDETNWNMGIAYVRQDKLDHAEAMFDRAIEINPNAAGVYDSLGDLYLYNRDDPRTALTYYSKALALVPTYFKANYHYGVASEKLADAAHDRALKTKSQTDAKEWLNRLTDAIDHYRTAAGGDPDDRDSHYNLANCLMQLRQYDEAIWNFREALRIDPNYAQAWTNLGNAYFQTQDYFDAIKAFGRALQIDPNLEPAKKGLQAARARVGG